MKACAFSLSVDGILLSLSIALLLSTSLPASATCSTPTGGTVPLGQHVILVIEENTSFGNVFPSGMPWLVNEAETKGGYSGQGCYNTDASGSLLDYLMLSGGSLFNFSPYNCNGNDCAQPLPNPNIFQLADDQPITWKVYAETYQNAGGYITAPDNSPSGVTHYYRRHNAVTWYAEALSNVLGAQGELVDFEQFYIDVANGTLPRYAIIVPDGLSDAHDASVGNADNFLKYNLDATGSVYTDLLTLPDFQAGGSGLLIVTFDNGNGDGAGNVFTTFIGPNVKQGYVSNFSYKHENTLRTMLDSLGITTYPGASNNAADMADFFSSNAGSVVVNSPANNSVQGPAVLVNAAARELGSSIVRMEVWDNGTKLGNVFADNIDQVYNVSGNGAHQMTIQDIGPGSGNPILHKEVVNYTISSSDGMFVTAPASGSNQAVLFPVEAYGVESTADIDHIEVWCDGKKVGDSPKGSTISQWYTNYSGSPFSMLTPGTHQLTVEDVSTSGVLHTSTFPITIVQQNNVYVNSPANNSTQSTSVLVNAYGYEQVSSTQQIDHMEVWDLFNGNSTKLGNSPEGYASSSTFINQTYTLPAGSHQLTIQDVGPSPYPVLHKVILNITVQ